MLEFIVLGQIPGTNIQLGFDTLVKLVLLAFAIVLIYIELFRIRRLSRTSISRVKLFRRQGDLAL